MYPFQQEIEDERKAKLRHFPYRTGVGSLSCWGSPAGLTASGIDVAQAFTTKFRNEFSNIENITVCALSSESLLRIVAIHEGEARPSSPGFRERELEWRRTHSATLKRFENEWVVLEAEEIIAHGRDPLQVIRDAKSKNIQNPYIFFVESESENLVRYGL